MRSVLFSIDTSAPGRCRPTACHGTPHGPGSAAARTTAPDCSAHALPERTRSRRRRRITRSAKLSYVQQAPARARISPIFSDKHGPPSALCSHVVRSALQVRDPSGRRGCRVIVGIEAMFASLVHIPALQLAQPAKRDPRNGNAGRSGQARNATMPAEAGVGCTMSMRD